MAAAYGSIPMTLDILERMEYGPVFLQNRLREIFGWRITILLYRCNIPLPLTPFPATPPFSPYPYPPPHPKSLHLPHLRNKKCRFGLHTSLSFTNVIHSSPLNPFIATSPPPPPSVLTPNPPLLHPMSLHLPHLRKRERAIWMTHHTLLYKCNTPSPLTQYSLPPPPPPPFFLPLTLPSPSHVTAPSSGSLSNGLPYFLKGGNKNIE